MTVHIVSVNADRMRDVRRGALAESAIDRRALDGPMSTESYVAKQS